MVQLGLSSIFAIALFCTGCSGLFYHPDSNMYFPPELNGYQQRNIYFQSKDGNRLHAWYFEANHPRGTIIQFHGNAENLTSHYATLIWLVEQGYSLFTFDYRGYGQSTGEPDQEGIYKDSLAALTKAWSFHKIAGAGIFVVYGQSLGGAVALRAFKDFPHQDETALIVMDSTFLSYKDVAQQTLKKTWLTWIFNPLARPLVSDQYSATESIEQLKTPLLVIHDQEDPIINVENGREIYQKAVLAKKELWVLKSGKHIGAFNKEGPNQRLRFVNFLNDLSPP